MSTLPLAICSTSILSSWVACPAWFLVPMDTGGASFTAGGNIVHVAIDDHSRIAFTQILPSLHCRLPRLPSCAPPWLTMLALGIVIHRFSNRQWSLLSFPRFSRRRCRTWFAPSLHSSLHPAHQWQSRTFYSNCPARMGLCPLLPQDSQHRHEHLLPWLHYYNWHRPHGSLNHARPPSAALASIGTTS